MIPTPEMIAAAWDAWAPRHKPRPPRLGPGPAFVEAIRAAFAVAPTDPHHRTGTAINRGGGEP